MIALTSVANALALLTPVIMAAGLAAFTAMLGGGGSHPGTGVNLNDLGGRVLMRLSLWQVDQPWAILTIIAGAFLAVSVAVAVVNYFASVLTLRIRTRAARLVQRDLLQHLFSLPLRYFHRERGGDLLARLTQDADNTGQGMGPLVRTVVTATTQLIGYTVYLVSTDAWLTVACALIIGGHFGLTELFKRTARRRARRVLDAQASLSATLQESLVAVRVIKSFGAERAELAKLSSTLDGVATARVEEGRVQRLEEPLRLIVDAVTTVVIFLIAALRVRSGQLGLQGLLMYVYVGRLLLAPANQTAVAMVWLQTLLASFDRVLDVLDERPDVEDGTEVHPELRDRLELRNVTFFHGATLVLDRVSLTIPKGGLVAVVGPSGAGKSTLTDLLLRLYDPAEGAVLIDGIDVRRLRQASYRRLFGVVSQENLLFHDTIANNIRYGRDELTEESIERAARMANAHEFIERLPLAYDAVVGDRGVRLSGGQRQRIALARAVVHNPQVLILDEATSALDSESEREVRSAIERITERATTIIVAHRISTVMHADTIVVMDAGTIVDVGAHQALLNRCELYRRLCDLQFSADAPVPLNG